MTGALLVPERECQVGLEEGGEIDGPDPRATTTKVDRFSAGRVKGMQATGVATRLDLQSVMPWLSGHLDPLVRVDRSDVVAVEADAERATSKLHNTILFSDQSQGCHHVFIPFFRRMS